MFHKKKKLEEILFNSLTNTGGAGRRDGKLFFKRNEPLKLLINYRVKEARLKEQTTTSFHLHEVLEQAKLIHGNRNENSGCLGRKWSRPERVTREIFEMVEMLYIFLAAYTIWVYTSAKIH